MLKQLGVCVRKCRYYADTSNTLESNRKDGHDAIIQDICTSRTRYENSTIT